MGKARQDSTDALSLHATPDDYDYTPASQLLPSYDDSEAAAASEPTDDVRDEDLTELPLLHDTYSGPQSTDRGSGTGVGEISDTTYRIDERLNDPDELHDYIVKYLSVVPPKCFVRVKGTHVDSTRRQNKEDVEKRIIDFDIVYSLRSQLPRPSPAADSNAVEIAGWAPHVAAAYEHVHRGSWRKSTLADYGVFLRDLESPAFPPLDLRGWCHDFCESRSRLKSFRVTRNVLGLDEEFLRIRLEQLIRSTKYCGALEITFPTQDKHIDIYNPSWINEWRNGWIRYIFYFSSLWIITWPLLFFLTKRWDVYRVDWRFSYKQTTDDGTEILIKHINEATWLDNRKQQITELALSRYQGDATDLPWDLGRGTRPRGPAIEYRNVEQAATRLIGATSVVMPLQRGSPGNWGALLNRSDGWGGDS